MNELLDKINENHKIIPAEIAIMIFVLALIYFAFFDKNKKGIIFSSLGVILGGFLFQLIINNIEKITIFVGKYDKVLSFPIISSAIGIFLANRILKYFTDKKNKKETSVLFVNAIDSQIRDLSCLNFYLIKDKMEENLDSIRFYNEKLNNNKFYTTAFNKIGIYEELEIDIISKYSINLQEFSSYIQQLLQEFSNYKQETLLKFPFQDEDKDLHSQSKTEYHYIRTFIIAKISISIALILGFLATYVLSKYFAKKYFSNPKKTFIEDYEKIIKELQDKFKLSHFHILNRIIAEDLVDRLIYIRNRYLELEDSIDYQKQRKPIFICRLSVNEDIIFPREEYDVEENYTTRFITLFSSTHDIVTFGDSKESASRKAKNIVESRLNDTITLKYVLDNSELKIDLVSPWN